MTACLSDMQVVGLPTPDISWYLDGKPIRPDDYHKMLVCEKSVHSFIIEIVTVHHVGVYECVAKNRAGESRFSLRLDVIGEQSSALSNNIDVNGLNVVFNTSQSGSVLLRKSLVMAEWLKCILSSGVFSSGTVVSSYICGEDEKLKGSGGRSGEVGV